MPDPEPFLALITPVDPSQAPGQGLPDAPGGIWPAPGHPDHDLPETEPPAGLWPPLPPDLPTQLPSIGWKPGTIWPPLVDNSLPTPPPTVGGGPVEPPPGVDNTLPPTPDQGLPTPPPTVGGGPVTPPTPTPPSGVLVLLAWVPGSGFRWVVVDTSLKPDNSLPAPPPTVTPTPPMPTPPIETPPPPTATPAV